MDHLPQANVIAVTFLRELFQNITSSHGRLPSIDELNLRDGNLFPRCIESVDINRRRSALGAWSVPDRTLPSGQFDECPRIAGRSTVLSAHGQLVEDSFGFALPSGNLTNSWRRSRARTFDTDRIAARHQDVLDGAARPP